LATNILWLGAHKTGTTFLQKSLDLSQDALRQHYVKYIELNEFRDKYTRPLVNRPDLSPAPCEFDWAGTNLVFDENIAALVQDVCTADGVYRHGPARARKVADYLKLRAPLLVLGVRSFETFLPSLYCEIIKAMPYRPFRKYITTPYKNLRWYPWIKALQAEFPKGRVLVYQYETLKRNERALLSRVIDVPKGSFTLLEGLERPGFSHQTIRHLRAKYRKGNLEQGDVRTAVKRFPKGDKYPAYAPWTRGETATLRRLYSQDIADIKRDQTIEFFNPKAI